MKDTQPPLNRRQLLKGGLASAIAASAPMILSSRVLGRQGHTGPNSRINIGLVGNGLISKGHRGYCATQEATHVVAICDVNSKLLKESIAEVKEKQGTDCDGHSHYEELCARKDIDAVMVMTPDHWHAAISIEAMRNGKDVYVEKPMSLTIEEGKAMRSAVERYGSILQVGSQQRSNRSFRKAAELVLNGYIGKVHTAVAQLGRFGAATQFAEQPVPDYLDYDRWLGPAPWEPYNIERMKGDYGGGWRRFWEYGSRKNGDWGAHHFDIIQWALGMDDSGPTLFAPKGHEGGEQFHSYANGIKVIRDGDSKGAMIRFIGEEGEVHVGRGDKFETTPVGLKSLVLKSSDTHLYDSPDHRADWLNCIRTRKQPICNVNVGHRTATICQLSGITERLNRPVRWDPKTEQIIGDSAAARMMDRPRRAPYTLPY